MKVLQLIATRSFYGAERVAYNLSKGLQDAGVSIIIVTSLPLLEKFSEIHPSSIYVLPNHEGNVVRRGHALLKEVSCLRQIISKERPDIIHVHGGLPRILMLATDTNRVVVETLHGVGLTNAQALQRLVFRISDALAALSFDGSIFYRSGIVRDYSGLRLLRANVVIHNAVDADFVRLISQTSQSLVEGKYVLWCSRLDALKGPDLLLLAFARLGRRDLKLVFLSDGPQRNYLKALAKTLGIDGQTVFRGYVNDVEKARFFQHASAICTNLTHPELTQTLLEAVFAGKPVIACYDSEVDQIFGERVILIKEPSVSNLELILSEILDSKRSRNQSVNLDSRFSLGYFTERYLRFYSTLKSEASV